MMRMCKNSMLIKLRTSVHVRVVGGGWGGGGVIPPPQPKFPPPPRILILDTHGCSNTPKIH